MSENEGVDLSKLRIHHEAAVKPARLPSGGWLKFIIGFAFVAACVVGAIFWKMSFTPASEVELTTVSLTTASQASSLLTASGYVVAQRKAAVASKATGRLVYLGVEEGDRVAKNEIIARIESTDVEAAYEQSKANLGIAQADLVNAKNTLDRTKKLLEQGLSPQSDLDAAQGAYDKVMANIASNVAGVQAAEVQLENTRIRAPFDGTVLTKDADVGEVVSAFIAGASSHADVVTIADMTSLQVEADVSESNLEKVTPNQPCEITLDAYPDIRYHGFVSKIVPTADRAKATVMTKVKFTNMDAHVLPEMGAKVHFLGAETEQKPTDSTPKLGIVLTAIAEKDGKKVVYQVKDKTVSEVSITTGDLIGNSLIEVKSGLEAGDVVVNHPAPDLKSGDVVKVKE
jgi:RND family efflux transporter MFP subunit